MNEYNWTHWIRTNLCERCADPENLDDAVQETDEFQCWLDLSFVALDLLVVFVWLLILIYTRNAIKSVRRNRCSSQNYSSTISRYPLHDFHWLLVVTLFLTHLADLGDVLLIWKNNPWQIAKVSLVVPICNALVVVLSCVYFDRIEVWQRAVYLLWLCPQWLAEAALNFVRWRHFHFDYTRETDAVGSVAIQLVITWMKIMLAVFLFVVDASTALQKGPSSAETESKAKDIHPPDKDTISTKSMDSVFVHPFQAHQVDKNPKCCYLHGQSNLLSKATFFWLNPLLLLGFWTPLEQKHLGPLPDDYKASQLIQQIRRLLDTKTPNLWRCYWCFSWRAILLGGWLKFFGDLVGYVAPLGIQVMVSYVNSSSATNSTNANNTAGTYYPSVKEFLSNGYIMAAIVFLSSFLQGTLSQASSHVLCVEGIRLKTALQSYMYEKSLRLSSLSGVAADSDKVDDDEHQKLEDASLQLDAGTLSQLLTEDCDNTMVFLCLCHYLWAIPLKLAILLYLLHQKLGVGSVIAALLCLLLMVPAQFLLGRNISHQNKSSMREAGRRLAKIHEWVSNMKLFRLYAWERSAMSRIRAVRRKELQHLWSYSIQWAWATFLTQASTVALTLLTFILYPFLSSSGTSPSAAEALSGLALINQFTVPLTIIPVIVPELIAACNSTLRLGEFFRKSDISVQRHHHSKLSVESVSGQEPSSATNESLSVRTLENIAEDEEHQQSSSDSCADSERSARFDQQEELAVRVSHATFSWHPVDMDNNRNDFKLCDISLDIGQGRLTAIVGHVGSGKSSLMMALLGELEMKSGSLTWASTASTQVGFVAQRPWLMHASLRDNILFGNALYAKRYSKVLEACALTQDVELFQQRDTTLIGSKGQNVSGGQKARISLARAIYSSASTLLLDDPFAALDLPVAQHVFQEAIQHILLRQGRSVIMATHHMEYALQADHVVVMDSGNILVQGPPEKVASVWPELLNHSSQSAQDSSSLSKGTAKDRWNMLRLVTKTGYVFKASGSRKEEEITIHPTDSVHGQRWKRRSSRLNALSIHMSHDLPLMTDEMTIDELLPDVGMACDRLYGSRSLRTRHLSSLNGPLPEALPSVPQQPRSISFSLKGPSSVFSSFVNRRRTRSRDRFSQIHHQPIVSLHPLADSSWSANGSGSSNSGRVGCSSNSHRPSLFRLYSTPVGKRSLEVDGGQRRTSAESDRSLLTVRRTYSDQESRQQQPGVQRLLSTVSGFSEEINIDPEDSDQERGLLRDPAAIDEERQYGRIPRRLYWIYARACGIFLTLSYFCGSIGWQSARLATDYWLVVYQIETHNSSSIDMMPNGVQHPTTITEETGTSYFYLGIYVLLSIVSVMAAIMTNILGQAAGNQGRKRLHDDLLTSLSRCHTRLFDVEPTGRLLNRFSSDMSMIDKKLATTVQRLVQFVLMCLSAIVINVVISPWSLLIAVFIVIIFYMLQRFFRTSARELQRLESLSKGPVVSHLTETLSGLATVRAFGQQRRFLQTMYERMDTHSAAVLVLNSTNRWLGFALDSLGAAVVLVAMLLALFVHRSYPDHLTPGQIGLAISYTLMTPIYLQWVVRFWSELEMYFNAVERVLHYSELHPESESTTVATDSQWPRKGDIEISNLSVTYHCSLEPVLRDLSLTIGHGQKIGICGRTGSGKSTLVNAIFRLADTATGHIKLDGIDIATLEPHYLRSRLTAVPQDTLIFAGTLRDNLDPEHQIPDVELWAALEAVHLKDSFRSIGLDGEMFKGGSCSLSVGQQQLFSLARASLRPSAILVLDEPSSALDVEAEQTLHHCLEHLFENRTILLVAHRLSSLRKCDWICVMENGQLVLQGTPDQVLNELPISD
uniref:ATP-binding cassette sub-family C member n=1 Tax=Daphnia magna TaxID=35525 RepID=A0A0N8CA55_9CRUS